jgi:hypothetical protein
MPNLFAKGALICAVLPLGLLTAGCAVGVGGEHSDGMGSAGFEDVVHGNWSAAKVDFVEDYNHAPNHPIAVFNMGATYHHDGDLDKASSLFSEAVIRGKGYVPDDTLEPRTAGITISEHACARLHRLNRLDANCGDQIVAVVTPPPVVQAAPAPEAEATVAAPKQDRH